MLSSQNLPLDPITISDDYGQAGAAGAWASPPHPPGQQDLSGTTGRTEQRTPPPNPLGQQYLSGTTGRQELHSEVTPDQQLLLRYRTVGPADV